VLKANPQNLPAMSTLGSCLLKSGKLEEAIAVDRKAAESNPRFDFVHANLASALTAKAASLKSAGKDPAASELAAEAEKEFDKALSLNPRNAEAVVSYAWLELKQQKPRAALELLQRALNAGVDDPDLELALGTVKAALEDPAGAAAAFDRSLALNPRSAQAHEAAGRNAYQRKDVRAAAEHYEKALGLEPTAALARTLGSIRLYDLRDRQGALKAYRMALELDPAGDDAPVLRQLITELQVPASP